MDRFTAVSSISQLSFYRFFNNQNHFYKMTIVNTVQAFRFVREDKKEWTKLEIAATPLLTKPKSSHVHRVLVTTDWFCYFPNIKPKMDDGYRVILVRLALQETSAHHKNQIIAFLLFFDYAL